MDARRNLPGLNRRGFLAAAAAGLGAAGLVASGAATASASAGTGTQAGLTEAVLAAFQTHRLVAISDSHQLQETHDLLTTLISDPRLPGVVNDIVVEFGNALYQDTIDTFVVDSQPVAGTALRPVWRNTTQSPEETWDAPAYEQIYRRVRAVNWTLPPARRIRVLGGDPPIDWPEITNSEQVLPFAVQRNAYPASVTEQQVLAKGRRALLFYGGGHLFHSDASSIPALIEQHTGERTYVILDLVPFTTDPGGLYAKLARYPRGTVIPAAGTWLGEFNAGDVLPSPQLKGQPPHNAFCGIPLGTVIDAGLYLGQATDLTASWPNPAIFLDPAYWNELQRRNAIQGNIADLSTYRQEQPPAYPLLPAPPACLAPRDEDR
jgi:hypothetical protein